MLGGASRYFYTTKANKKEREAGLDYPTNHSMRANHHPTVKPIDLMRYLCRLITPLDGTVLDPFAGSGTTLCAAALEGFNVLGVERELEYVRIAEARLAHWSGGAYEPSTPTDTKPTIKTGDQLNLF
jgi:site-specific DNA-methyltransferase (adenine-specific)